MLIWFRLKALYLLVIAGGISFLWALFGFLIFGSSIAEDTLALALLPLWCITFGLSIILTDLYWRVRDPAANLFFALFSTKTWGRIVVIIGIIAMVSVLNEYKIYRAMSSVGIYAIISNTLLVWSYLSLKKRYNGRTSTTPPRA